LKSPHKEHSVKKTMMKNRGGLLAFFLILAGTPGYAQEDIPLVNTQTLSLAGADTLSIEYGDDDVFIRESETGALILKEFMSKDNPRYHAVISRSGGALRVRQGRRPWFPWFWKSRTEIYLPRTFRENFRISNSSGSLQAETDLLGYKTLDVSVRSGSVSLGRVSGETVSIRLSSGDLDIRDAAGNSFISVSSGRLQIGELAGGEHRIKIASGRARIGAIQGASVLEISSGGIAVENARGSLDIHASSGSVTVGNFSGGGSFDISSGTITLGIEELTGDLRFSLSSGDITMNIPREIPFNLDALTRSGRTLVYEGETEALRLSGNSTALRPFGPSPARTIYARTNSGSLTIRRR
jgi:hypothetical protein